jgi:hypothetical protein
VQYQVSLAETVGNRALEDRVEAAPDNPAAELTLTAPRLSATGERERLTLTLDGTRIVVDLTHQTPLYDALMAIPNVALLAVVTGSGSSVSITTRTQSSASRVKAAVRTASRWTISSSMDERGLDAFGASITAAEIVGMLGSLEGAKATANAEGKLELEATATGQGSTVTVSGNLADLVFGAQAKTQTIAGTPPADQLAGFGDVDAGFKTLVSWNHELQKLPEDTRNLTRPLTEALDDTLAAFSALESANKAFAETFEQGPPPPPEAIGLMAGGGITLGTQDRIVGSGGKGIVFIFDGGTGSPDRAKFVATEGWVADIDAWSAWIKNPAQAASWPAPLRALHPPTTHVDVHAKTQVEHVVLPFRMQLTTQKAKLGIVTPVGTDRRQQLLAEKNRLQRIKDDVQDEKDDIDAELLRLNTKIAEYTTKRDSPTGVLASEF